jgi:SOS-response transcriptional repressor LexA
MHRIIPTTGVTPMANSRPPLTEFQKRVYEEIHHSSGRTAATIAQRAGLPSGKHVGRALDRIREKGYIVGDEQASRGGRGGKWVRVRG